ncbi:MAG: AAA family ATPase, partial [Planctomycetota bacterium]|nr:AAA family ATPase [Planctomycetota bacterium]
GVGTGVKEVLRLVQEDPTGPFQQVRGLLADLLRVNVESAALIEVALGDKAQHLVVAPGDQLLNHLATEQSKWQGRVGFLPLDMPAVQHDSEDLSDHPGVLGRADQFVESEPELKSLVERLLGRTWIVDSLATAIALSRDAADTVSFVTPTGELVAADGTITVGPRHTSTGLISRRSELRALRLRIEEWERKVAEVDLITTDLESQVSQRDERVTTLATAHQTAADELSELKMRLNVAEQRQSQLESQYQQTTDDARSATDQCQAVIQTRTITRGKLEQIQSGLTQTEARMQENSRRIDQLDASRQTRSRESMGVKLELARCDQQLDHLRGEIRRFEQEQAERHRGLHEGTELLATTLERATEAEFRILAAESELAELYLKHESLARESGQFAVERESLRAQKVVAHAEIQKLRGRIRKLEDKIHKKQLAAEGIRHERTTLEDRLREDYNIELSQLTEAGSAEQQTERLSIEAEIADLRRKLTNIGGVNLESLQEADELESRFDTLSSQLQDLTKARHELEQIIGKINADSRRLFAETLETVKEHFQVLFRKLFGGGRADIILEEGIDILDSGIEIVARPPGKEPRNISLLSGGEKTMTCVALLLAIFRSRPSPFCVLDEVDAALDEANIERFVSVLNEFLVLTQFIVVTHSKKTMACANTLYGVTMQESGISKRVSVRFEDVSEDGHIHHSAVEREAALEASNSAAEESTPEENAA